MSPEQYDAWYETRRGRWIGETECRLLEALLAPLPGESVLDVGCGTGYFTRRFALRELSVTGVDLEPAMLRFANQRAAAGERYLPGEARALPFADGSFDLSVSVTALCFVPEERQALEEMLRVTRRRFAIGLLNRHSLLYLDKGRDGGRGAYRGAHWHTRREIESLFSGLPVADLTFRTPVLFPWGCRIAAALTSIAGARTPRGGFMSSRVRRLPGCVPERFAARLLRLNPASAAMGARPAPRAIAVSSNRAWRAATYERGRWRRSGGPLDHCGNQRASR